MNDTPDTAKDWRDTVFLPKTDFPMKAGLAAKEPAILERWARIGVYDRLREQRKGRDLFVLHDGPPYANGDIHMGHAMNKVLKDIIVRSQSLMGKDAPYVPGWDCHGLPIEWKVEEAYRAKKQNKDEVPVAQFRAECRAYADRWVGVQRDQFQRLGVMGDWADPYLTMAYKYQAAIVRALESDTQTKLVAKPQLRGAEGNKLTLNLGDQVPIVTTSYTPIATGGVGVNPLNSFQLKPVGINIDITPVRVTLEGDILIDMNVESSSRGSDVNVAGTNYPSFGSRKVGTRLRLRDGE